MSVFIISSNTTSVLWTKISLANNIQLEYTKWNYKLAPLVFKYYQIEKVIISKEHRIPLVTNDNHRIGIYWMLC